MSTLALDPLHFIYVLLSKKNNKDQCRFVGVPWVGNATELPTELGEYIYLIFTQAANLVLWKMAIFPKDMLLLKWLFSLDLNHFHGGIKSEMSADNDNKSANIAFLVQNFA